jgi:hypothetical protein
LDAQLCQIEDKLLEMTAWLHKLQKRMEAKRFPPDDELLRQAKRTHSPRSNSFT